MAARVPLTPGPVPVPTSGCLPAGLRDIAAGSGAGSGAGAPGSSAGPRWVLPQRPPLAARLSASPRLASPRSGCAVLCCGRRGHAAAQRAAHRCGDGGDTGRDLGDTGGDLGTRGAPSSLSCPRLSLCKTTPPPFRFPLRRGSLEGARLLTL